MVGQIIVTIDDRTNRAHVVILIDGVPTDDVNLLADARDVLERLHNIDNNETVKPMSIVFNPRK